MKTGDQKRFWLMQDGLLANSMILDLLQEAFAPHRNCSNNPPVDGYSCMNCSQAVTTNFVPHESIAKNAKQKSIQASAKKSTNCIV